MWKKSEQFLGTRVDLDKVASAVFGNKMEENAENVLKYGAMLGKLDESEINAYRARIDQVRAQTREEMEYLLQVLNGEKKPTWRQLKELNVRGRCIARPAFDSVILEIIVELGDNFIKTLKHGDPLRMELIDEALAEKLRERKPIDPSLAVEFEMRGYDIEALRESADEFNRNMETEEILADYVSRYIEDRWTPSHNED